MTEIRIVRSNRPPDGWDRLNIWLPDELKAAAQTLASRRGLTVSELVRDLLADALRHDAISLT